MIPIFSFIYPTNQICSDPELELADNAPTELYYTPCANPESTKPWQTHDISILKNQLGDSVSPNRHEDPDSIKVVAKSRPPSITPISKLEPPRKKEHSYDDSHQLDHDAPIIVERPSNPQPPNRLLSDSLPIDDRDETNSIKMTSSNSQYDQQNRVTEDLVRTILIPRFSPMPMKSGSVESLVTRKQSAYFARLRLLFEEGFGNTPQDRDGLDELNQVSKEVLAPASYPLQKPTLSTRVKEFSAPVKKPGPTKQFQGIQSSAEVKEEGKKMIGNSIRKVVPELPLKPFVSTDSRRSVPESPSESGMQQRPSLGQMGFIRPKRPRTHNLRPHSPKLPVMDTYSPDEDLFKIPRSPANGSNSSPRKPFRTQPFALTSQTDKNNWNRRPSFVPRGSDLLSVAEPPEPDTDPDEVSGRVVKLGGIPMPGLVGPEASSLLARIKQKQMHVFEQTKLNSAKTSEGNGSEVNEIQKALTALKSKTVRQEKEPKNPVSAAKKTEGQRTSYM
ncbi:uncharacterized protein DEA37_0002298 [Paragonimus westermani]|uniref:Uncharacterized protein n=1 Tax=Paragonimus westermani TaxID=34504 RepID=A0A5J4P0K7_9TREM|nr:uncharacterized protein DEA37_0002298 [Paragonimus westermani]